MKHYKKLKNIKKLSVLLLFIPVFAFGQSFDFVSGVGIRNAQDYSKGFIVYDFPGMSAEDDHSSGRIQYGENNNISLIASTERNSLFTLGVGYNYDPECGIEADFTMDIYYKVGEIRY